MDYVEIALLLAYIIIMMTAISYMGRKSIATAFFTGILFVVLGYVIHIPYFNLTMITLLSMAIAGVIVYRLFLEDKA
jgi:uncharacterized membrane protein YcaP (DUF421 family)